ncbi:helix-hairpin-helix domain-containing protein [Chitinophagaceae bacterium MMS25-I14]
MPWWIKQPDITEEKALLETWNRLQKTSPENAGYADTETGSENAQPAHLFAFDPNTVDSTAMRQLGFAARTAHLLINWRLKGKHFYSKEDLRSLYTLTAEQYQTLEPYIQIAESSRPSYTREYQPFQRVAIPDIIDLNHTDSAMLERLNGIGPTLAHKIIERRKALGGFNSITQLQEIYRFPDTVFRQLSAKFIIHKQDVQRIALNSCNIEELVRHPYVGEKMAKNILLLRQGLGRFENVEQLRQVPLMNEENYRKIAPYFTAE